VVLVTGELPWIEVIEVEVRDEVDVEAPAFHLAPEVELDQLLLRRVEPEPRHHQVVVVRVPDLAAAAHRRLATSSTSSSCRRAAGRAMPVLKVPAHGIALAPVS
jgi:hypothetical protein